MFFDYIFGLECINQAGGKSKFSTLYLVPCTLYLVPCTLYLVPCTLYLVPCTLYLVIGTYCAN